MATHAELDEAKARAERTIRSNWRAIACSYTLGWGGPISDVERQFPFVREAVLSIRQQVSSELPVLFFQSRESAPKDMLAAVPFWKDTGNPFNCRLAAVRTVLAEEQKLYGEFAQALWFTIKMKMLPDPRERDRFHKAILSWTGREFF